MRVLRVISYTLVAAFLGLAIEQMMGCGTDVAQGRDASVPEVQVDAPLVSYPDATVDAQELDASIVDACSHHEHDDD